MSFSKLESSIFAMHQSTTRVTLQDIHRMDTEDNLSKMRDKFDIPEGIYLDGVLLCAACRFSTSHRGNLDRCVYLFAIKPAGNSLGCLPKETPVRIQEVVQQQWGRDLITSWNKHKWIDIPKRIGGKIALLLGAKPDEVIVADSTSVNVFKTVSAALDLNPGRRTIISERSNFPTDLYILEGLIQLKGSMHKLVLIDNPNDMVNGSVDLSDVAVVLLTHVSYCTGRMLDMQAITSAIQQEGAVVVWDLSHSVGAVPVYLNKCNADFAIGCGYKYLNGGPGAPAFLFVATRHQAKAENPLCGWMGHRSMFDFEEKYAPASGVDRFLCGTAPILACVSLEVGVDLMLEADQQAIRKKSVALGELFLQLLAQECKDDGFQLCSPEHAEERGSQVNIRHPEGYAIIQALIARGVTGDFRSPDILRFGFTPLYTSYLDVWHAVCHLRGVMQCREWDCKAFKTRNKVT